MSFAYDFKSFTVSSCRLLYFVCLSVSSFRKYISSSSLSILLYLSLSVCLSLLSIRFFLSHCQSLPLIFFASSSCIPVSSRYLFVSSCHSICLSLSSVCFCCTVWANLFFLVVDLSLPSVCPRQHHLFFISFSLTLEPLCHLVITTCWPHVDHVDQSLSCCPGWFYNLFFPVGGHHSSYI